MTNHQLVLKGVSRSFYLSLRLLPMPMRGAASLAYLLARTSDTVADTAAAPLATRTAAMDSFARAVAGDGGDGSWPPVLLERVMDPAERRLLDRTAWLLEWLAELPAGQAQLVREVVATIVSGQQLDLQYFAGADQARPVALADDAALVDYTWRVAGCVGGFWTRLGWLTLGDRFATADAAWMLERGIAYGRGLQLVNILRDLPDDLSAGRCYLPCEEPRDVGCLLEERDRWLEQARQWVAGGFEYSSALRSRRLRVASVLPAMLAMETLERMRGTSWQQLRARIKVPRRRVYLAMARAFFARCCARH